MAINCVLHIDSLVYIKPNEQSLFAQCKQTDFYQNNLVELSQSTSAFGNTISISRSSQRLFYGKQINAFCCSRAVASMKIEKVKSK